jgi:hypothetical protein
MDISQIEISSLLMLYPCSILFLLNQGHLFLSAMQVGIPARTVSWCNRNYWAGAHSRQHHHPSPTSSSSPPSTSKPKNTSLLAASVSLHMPPLPLADYSLSLHPPGPRAVCTHWQLDRCMQAEWQGVCARTGSTSLSGTGWEPPFICRPPPVRPNVRRRH